MSLAAWLLLSGRVLRMACLSPRFFSRPASEAVRLCSSLALNVPLWVHRVLFLESAGENKYQRVGTGRISGRVLLDELNDAEEQEIEVV